jgi:hypothetical protein
MREGGEAMKDAEQQFYLYISELHGDDVINNYQVKKLKDIFKDAQEEMRKSVEREMSDSRWF